MEGKTNIWRSAVYKVMAENSLSEEEAITAIAMEFTNLDEKPSSATRKSIDFSVLSLKLRAVYDKYSGLRIRTIEGRNIQIDLGEEVRRKLNSDMDDLLNGSL